MTPQRRMWLNSSSRAWANEISSEELRDFFLLMHHPFKDRFRVLSRSIKITDCTNWCKVSGQSPVTSHQSLDPAFLSSSVLAPDSLWSGDWQLETDDSLLIIFISPNGMNLTEGDYRLSRWVWQSMTRCITRSGPSAWQRSCGL